MIRVELTFYRKVCPQTGKRLIEVVGLNTLCAFHLYNTVSYWNTALLCFFLIYLVWIISKYKSICWRITKMQSPKKNGYVIPVRGFVHPSGAVQVSWKKWLQQSALKQISQMQYCYTGHTWLSLCSPFGKSIQTVQISHSTWD